MDAMRSYLVRVERVAWVRLAKKLEQRKRECRERNKAFMLFQEKMNDIMSQIL